MSFWLLITLLFLKHLLSFHFGRCWIRQLIKRKKLGNKPANKKMWAVF